MCTQNPRSLRTGVLLYLRRKLTFQYHHCISTSQPQLKKQSFSICTKDSDLHVHIQQIGIDSNICKSNCQIGNVKASIAVRQNFSVIVIDESDFEIARLICW